MGNRTSLSTHTYEYALLYELRHIQAEITIYSKGNILMLKSVKTIIQGWKFKALHNLILQFDQG